MLGEVVGNDEDRATEDDIEGAKGGEEAMEEGGADDMSDEVVGNDEDRRGAIENDREGARGGGEEIEEEAYDMSDEVVGNDEDMRGATEDNREGEKGGGEEAIEEGVIEVGTGKGDKSKLRISRSFSSAFNKPGKEFGRNVQSDPYKSWLV